MKDRWKIFLTCVVIAVLLGIVIGSIAASFKKVDLRQYGILYYTVFSRVDNQSARANGNYLVGLDYDFHKFPSGIISINFTTMALTKDMSIVQIQGFFAGRLIMEQVTNMYILYGNQYFEFLKASVEEFTRQAIQSYSLSDLIYNRAAVQNNVKGFVCLQIQTLYSWAQCDYVSLGRVGANIPEPEIIPTENSFELKKIELLQRQIESQKKLNFYMSGGFQILKSLQKMDSQLFLDVSNLVVSAVKNRPPVSQIDAIDAAKYFIMSANFPMLKNSLQLKL